MTWNCTGAKGLQYCGGGGLTPNRYRWVMNERTILPVLKFIYRTLVQEVDDFNDVSGAIAVQTDRRGKYYLVRVSFLQLQISQIATKNKKTFLFIVVVQLVCSKR